ncbi:hypothetical protein BU25DRAFT_336311, partial [Macroventuria anomochaeta]
PHAITEDCDEHWRICFNPDIAGTIMDEPRLISKITVLQLYPNLAKAWEAQPEKQKIEAQRIEQKSITFMRRLNNARSSLYLPKPPDLGVACDQHLLPGMRRHWGKPRTCTTHPSDQASFGVCKCCRVDHQMQLSTSRDRQFVATRGARVPVCSNCEHLSPSSGSIAMSNAIAT